MPIVMAWSYNCWVPSLCCVMNSVKSTLNSAIEVLILLLLRTHFTLWNVFLHHVAYISQTLIPYTYWSSMQQRKIEIMIIIIFKSPGHSPARVPGLLTYPGCTHKAQHRNWPFTCIYVVINSWPKASTCGTSIHQLPVHCQVNFLCCPSVHFNMQVNLTIHVKIILK